jgi:phosphoenolpyruvate carboxylase
MAQPPGSVDGGFRVTEQGEMIRFKFGMPEMAQKSMSIYLTATLEARMAPPPVPKDDWRECISTLAEQAVLSYRSMVTGEPDFVPYFRSLTPEQELGKLALGSRPAKRNAQGGVESLRAIPWIFAWTQARLMLPAWLGADEALDQEGETLELLQKMYQQWPFFQTYIDMLEMVLCKTEPEIAEYYEKILVDKALFPIGKKIRQRLANTGKHVNRIKQQPSLIFNQPLLKQTMAVRNPYTDPLHYLQAELLRRYRQEDNLHSDIDKALVVSMAGIAAGLRNTG